MTNCEFMVWEGYLEKVREVGPRRNWALRDVAAPIVPLVAPHGEPVPMNGDAVSGAWKVYRDVVIHIDLQKV